MSENYIKNHFDNIKKYASEVESRPKTKKKLYGNLPLASFLFSYNADGRTRTGTAVNRLILSQVRLPFRHSGAFGTMTIIRKLYKPVNTFFTKKFQSRKIYMVTYIYFS